MLGREHPIKATRRPDFNGTPDRHDPSLSTKQMISARTCARGILWNGADLDEVRHDGGLRSVRHDGDRPDSFSVTCQHVLDEVTDDRAGLARTAIDDATPQKAAGIPLQVDRPAPTRRIAVKLQPARPASWFMFLDDLKLERLELAILRDSLAKTLTPPAIYVNKCLHDFNCRTTGFSGLTAGISRGALDFAVPSAACHVRQLRLTSTCHCQDRYECDIR